MQPGDYDGAAAALQRVQAFVRAQAVKIMEAARREAATKGVELTPEAFAESNFLPVAARRRLPRNCGQADLVDERQKIAEVAAKYLQACEMLLEIGVRPLSDPEERRRFFARMCTEEQARVYEATVHNLQSTYDTHIQNTLIEGGDERLGQLRGHASAALHLLEAVTYLVHFIERHENEVRNEEAKRRVSELIDRSEVQGIVLNDLLHWADRFLQTGAPLAEALLPAYSNLQRLEVEIPDHVTLHARPAALIVGIVNRHGTPVEMELCGQRCNAGSILELLVAVGSSPGEKRFVFHGDERPLRDIRLLFEHRLGERGISSLPEALDYLRDA
jgi:phosphotransferase system HPr (HPr) family protein